MRKTTDKIKHAANALHRCWRRLQVFVERGTPTLSVSKEETECTHCGHVFRGNYCPRCGQNCTVGKGKPRFLKTFREAYPELSNNFVRTIIHLLLRPGYMMRDYFCGHRVIYRTPVSTFLIAISIVAICTSIGQRIAPTLFETQQMAEYNQFSNVPTKIIEEVVKKDPKMTQIYDQWQAQRDKTPSSSMSRIWDVVKEKLTSNITISLFALFPILGLTSYCFFRRRKFDGRRLSIMEHYIIFVYLFSISNFFDLIDPNGLLTVLYLAWSYRGLYRLPWWKAFSYTFLVMLISFIIMFFVVLLLTIFIMVQMMYNYM